MHVYINSVPNWCVPSFFLSLLISFLPFSSFPFFLSSFLHFSLPPSLPPILLPSLPFIHLFIHPSILSSFLSSSLFLSLPPSFLLSFLPFFGLFFFVLLSSWRIYALKQQQHQQQDWQVTTTHTFNWTKSKTYPVDRTGVSFIFGVSHKLWGITTRTV